MFSLKRAVNGRSISNLLLIYLTLIIISLIIFGRDTMPELIILGISAAICIIIIAGYFLIGLGKLTEAERIAMRRTDDYILPPEDNNTHIVTNVDTQADDDEACFQQESDDEEADILLGRSKSPH